MATTVNAFSPKEWRILIRPQTEWGTTEAGTDMYQLDVDSISMPSLNPNQSLDVRTSAGRTAITADVFTDRVLAVKEMTFSGNFHTDSGHKLLFHNISDQATSNDEVNIASGFNPSGLANGASVSGGSMTSHSLFTVVVARPASSVSSNLAKNMEFLDCVVTNFQISADVGTDGGRYKYSVTFATGSAYSDLDDATTVSPTAVYASSTNVTLGTLNSSTLKVFNINHALNSFSVNVDSPAVFVGAGSGGFESLQRGQECSVTFDAQVKYDDTGDDHIQAYDTGAVHDNVGLYLQNTADFDISINDYIITNAALSEGDIMMLDLSGKAVDDGTEALLTLDWR